jgi:hypothetical protein
MAQLFVSVNRRYSCAEIQNNSHVKYRQLMQIRDGMLYNAFTFRITDLVTIIVSTFFTHDRRRNLWDKVVILHTFYQDRVLKQTCFIRDWRTQGLAGIQLLFKNIIQCVPLAGSPAKCWFTKRNKSAIHLHVIPVMKCGCVFWEFAKRKLATRKAKIR